jgi:hypothetical protein
VTAAVVLFSHEYVEPFGVATAARVAAKLDGGTNRGDEPSSGEFAGQRGYAAW